MLSRWILPTVYDLVMAPLAPLRRRVVPRAHGRVLEIGSGTGLNFAHYDAIDALVAIDPDRDFHGRARRRAQGLDFEVQIDGHRAEALPYPDASFDSAVITFVLCTLPDLPGALTELRRVLRPGGTLLFAEHVRAEGFEARAQRALNPLWSRLAGGCHLDRPSVELLAEGGFELVETHRSRRKLPLFPFVSGVARVR